MQCPLTGSRALVSIRHPAAELFGEAREDGGRRDHRDLLSDERPKRRTGRRRQPPHPDVRVEIRTLVDHLGQHLIGRAQPGEPDTDLLREPSSRSPALLKLDKANRPTPRCQYLGLVERTAEAWHVRRVCVREGHESAVLRPAALRADLVSNYISAGQRYGLVSEGGLHSKAKLCWPAYSSSTNPDEQAGAARARENPQDQD